MTPQELIESAQKRGAICSYCHHRPVDTYTERLFLCCSTCSNYDNKIVKKESLPCVVCGYPVIVECGSNEISHMNVDHISFRNGMAGCIAYGYGCKLDGNVYMIAVCERCTKQKEKEGKLIYSHSYI